jgi:hypothetical protein
MQHVPGSRSRHRELDNGIFLVQHNSCIAFLQTQAYKAAPTIPFHGALKKHIDAIGRSQPIVLPAKPNHVFSTRAEMQASRKLARLPVSAGPDGKDGIGKANYGVEYLIA